MKQHYRDIRLINNAGISIPVCMAGEKMLDLDSSAWPITLNKEEVTCKHCIKAWDKRYSWAGSIGQKQEVD